MKRAKKIEQRSRVYPWRRRHGMAMQCILLSTFPLERLSFPSPTKETGRRTGAFRGCCQGSLINLKALIYTSFFSLRTSFQLTTGNLTTPGNLESPLHWLSDHVLKSFSDKFLTPRRIKMSVFECVVERAYVEYGCSC
jgi:hypothetical protein